MSENVLNSLPPRLVQKAAREAAKFKPRLLYYSRMRSIFRLRPLLLATPLPGYILPVFWPRA